MEREKQGEEKGDGKVERHTHTQRTFHEEKKENPKKGTSFLHEKLFGTCLFHLLAGRTLATVATEATAAATETTAGRSAVTTEARAVLAVAKRRAALVLDLRAARLEGVGDDLLGQVEVVAEVHDALVRERPVEPAPVERLCHVLAALQALHELQQLTVVHLVDQVVLLGKEILLRHHHALTEEVRVHKVALLLGDYHPEKVN